MKVCSGKFVNSFGQPFVGAKVWFRLSQDAVAVGNAQIAPQLVSATTDSSGAFSVSMWFNDELSPALTTYSVAAVASGGGLIWGAENVSITGASFDLNSAVPTSVGVLLANPVVQNPASQQTINGFPLVMEGANLGFSAAASTVGDAWLSRISAGILGAGTLSGNVLGIFKATAFIDTSANPAQSGVFRGGNNVVLVAARNQANGADLSLLASDASNNVVLAPPIKQVEQAAPGGIASSDLFYADSTAHRWKANNNNAGAQTFMYLEETSIMTKYNNVSLVANGIPSLVAKVDVTAQSANIGATLLYAVPANGAGFYRVSAYVVVTQQATTSSTVPNSQVNFTDNDTNTAGKVASTTNNSAGSPVNPPVGFNSTDIASATGSVIINVKANTNINYLTANYASVGATSMQYAVHFKLEYLGS